MLPWCLGTLLDDEQVPPNIDRWMRPFGMGIVLHQKYEANFHLDWRRPGKLLTSCNEPLPVGESMPDTQQTIFDFAWRAIPALKEARFPTRR